MLSDQTGTQLLNALLLDKYRKALIGYNEPLPKESEMMITSFFFTVVGLYDAEKVPEGIEVTPEQEGRERIAAVIAEGTIHIPHDPGSDGRLEAELAVYRYHMPDNAPGPEDTRAYLRPFCS